jgi:hypothetical protein
MLDCHAASDSGTFGTTQSSVLCCSADLIQKMGNFLSATVLARLQGILTGSGDKNRPVVLLWMISDLIDKVVLVVSAPARAESLHVKL